MSKNKHTEAHMIAALKQVEAGRKVGDVARECGVSKHTIYAWKAKYGGMDVSEAQEARQLRDENSRLRKLVADLSLDKRPKHRPQVGPGSRSAGRQCSINSSHDPRAFLRYFGKEATLVGRTCNFTFKAQDR